MAEATERNARKVRQGIVSSIARVLTEQRARQIAAEKSAATE